MKKIIFLVLFFSGKIFAQDLDKIKQADTVYIYFKEDKKNQIHNIITTLNEDKKYDEYFFDFHDRYRSFRFSNLQSLNNQKEEKKRFLKKNKDLILNYDFIEKKGELFIAEMIGYGYRSKKVVYVIEENEIKCSKITLKQVTIVGPVRVNEE